MTVLEIRDRYKGLAGPYPGLSTKRGPTESAEELRTQIKRALPSILVAAVGDTVFLFDRDNEFVSMGAVEVERGNKYSVYGPNIENRKYASYNSRYTSVIRTGMASAVKTAHTMLRPLRVSDLHAQLSYQVRRSISAAYERVDYRYGAACKSLGIAVDSLAAQILADIGGADLRLEEFLRARTDYVDPILDARRVHMVHHKPNRGVYDIVQMNFYRKDHTLSCTGTPQTLAPDDVPQVIHDRTAALAILDAGEWVPSVGMRVYDNIWYVVE